MENFTVESMSHEAYIGVAVALGVIGFCGFFLNLLVLIIIISDSRHLWTPVNVVLANLAVCLRNVKEKVFKCF